MQDSERRRLVRGLSFALGAGFLADGGSAEQTGHGTVPATGAAARSSLPTAEPEEDLVLAWIDGLREELRETGKRYKKLKPASQAERRAEMLEVLTRSDREVASLRDLVDRVSK
jgi:predicted trehalose synthase